MPDIECPPLATQAALLGGLKAGLVSPLIFVTLGTFIGIGALAHDLGFSLGWSIVCSVLLWAAPAQVILMTGLSGGAAPIGIAVAVGLSGVRLLPMVVSLIPVMRSPRTRLQHLILPAHFVAVTLWIEGLRLLPGLPRENRAAFMNGLGAAFTTAATVSTTAGFHMAAGLPTVLTAALLMLTPLSFLMSTAGNARSLPDRLALPFGLVLGPLLAAFEFQLDLLWAGVIGGTLAYAASRLWKLRR